MTYTAFGGHVTTSSQPVDDSSFLAAFDDFNAHQSVPRYLRAPQPGDRWDGGLTASIPDIRHAPAGDIASLDYGDWSWNLPNISLQGGDDGPLDRFASNLFGQFGHSAADGFAAATSDVIGGVDQLFRGEFTDRVTWSGTAAQAVAGFFGVDVLADIRDVAYHLSRGDIGEAKTAAFFILPVVGALKPFENTAELTARSFFRSVPNAPRVSPASPADVRLQQMREAAASRNSTGTGTEGIYEFPDQTAGGTPYVGQSKNVPSRLNQHQAAGRLAPGTETTKPVSGGTTTREFAEHNRIQELTGGQTARNSPNVSNKKDPIGPARRPGLGLPEPRE